MRPKIRTVAPKAAVNFNPLSLGITVFMHTHMLIGIVVPTGSCCAERKAVKSARTVCTDAGGFDRVAFHKKLDAVVLAFLRKHLAEATRS
jgi:hypothetical protein